MYTCLYTCLYKSCTHVHTHVYTHEYTHALIAVCAVPQAPRTVVGVVETMLSIQLVPCVLLIITAALSPSTDVAIAVFFSKETCPNGVESCSLRSEVSIDVPTGSQFALARFVRPFVRPSVLEWRVHQTVHKKRVVTSSCTEPRRSS